MAQNVFNRYEKKYLMPEEVYRSLRSRLAPWMQTDRYGLHTICNLYYDTPDSLLIRRSLEKPVYKEKLRLRSYGVPSADSRVFLEIKKKYQGVVNKRRISLTLEQAYDYVERGIRPPAEGPILEELDFFLGRYELERGVFLAYDRVALFGKENPEFRVTFDRSIRFRRTAMGLEEGDGGELLLKPGWYLMESKVLGATPLWFTEILSDLALYPTSFSKYGSVFKLEQGRFDLDRQMVHRLENWNAEKQRRKQVC